MHFDGRHPNVAMIHLDPGERLYFRLSLLRTRHADFTPAPPFPFESPIARIFHGCYWLATYESASPETLVLMGPQLPGTFASFKVEAGHVYYVDTRYLAAVVREPGSRFETLIGKLFSIRMWFLLRMPLPVVVQGPAHIVLYGPSLRRLSPLTSAGCPAEVVDLLPSQIAAFDASMRFTVTALKPGSRLLGHFYNATAGQIRWTFELTGELFVEDLHRGHRHLASVALRLLIHFVTWCFIALILKAWVVSGP